MRRTPFACVASVLLAGCASEATVVDLEPMQLPSVDCDDPLLRSLVRPLNTQLVAGGAGVEGVQVGWMSTDPDRVLLAPQDVVVVVVPPFEEPWQDIDPDEVWAEFAGNVADTEGTDQGVFVSGARGALDPWLVVDLPDFCDDGQPAFEAIVTLLAPGGDTELIVRFGDPG